MAEKTVKLFLKTVNYLKLQKCGLSMPALNYYNSSRSRSKV